MPQRKTKHLHVLIAQDKLQGASVKRVYDELVGEVDIEISQMAVQQFLNGGRSINVQRCLSAHKVIR
jgi:hypothetical protein